MLRTSADGAIEPIQGLPEFDAMVGEILRLYRGPGSFESAAAGLDAIPFDQAGPSPVHTPPVDWGLRWRGIPLRVTYQPTASFLHVAISRGLWPIPTLEQLGHNEHFAAALRRAMTRPGLILVIGHMGVGKSTTMWSALLDHVARTNIKAVVLEDVNELPAQGRYGDAGIVLQVAVKPGAYGLAIPHQLRQRAQLLVINEVRDHPTARELLLAAGRVPVMTTGHANDIEQGLASLRDLAAGPTGGAWAATTLASSLVAVIYLRDLVRRENGGFSIAVDALFLGGKSEDDDKIRSLIRHDQLTNLREHIRRQAAGRWQISDSRPPPPPASASALVRNR